MREPERIAFYVEGDEVIGTLFLPGDLAKGEQRAGIVIAGGYGGDRSEYVGRAEDFNKEGYVVLTFDYRCGVGESKYRGAASSPGFLTMFPEACIDDVRCAVRYLITRTEVNSDKIGLFGASAGGGFVLPAAVAEPQVACVICEGGIGDGYRVIRTSRNPWEFRQFINKIEEDRIKRLQTGKSDLVPVATYPGGEPGLFVLGPEERKSWTETTKWFPRLCMLEFQTTLEACDRWLEFKPELSADKISPRPVMFLGMETSVIVPPEEALLAFEKAREPKKLVMFPAGVASSRYAKFTSCKDRKYVPEVLKPIMEWFQNYIPAR